MTTTTHSRSDWRVVILVVAPLYLTALVYLLFLGKWMDVGLMLANTLFISLLAWLTVRLTRPMPVSYTHLDVYKRQSTSSRSPSARPRSSARCARWGRGTRSSSAASTGA